jgi:hypothetical protein
MYLTARELQKLSIRCRWSLQDLTDRLRPGPRVKPPFPLVPLHVRSYYRIFVRFLSIDRGEYGTFVWRFPRSAASGCRHVAGERRACGLERDQDRSQRRSPVQAHARVSARPPRALPRPQITLTAGEDSQPGEDSLPASEAKMSAPGDHGRTMRCAVRHEQAASERARHPEKGHACLPNTLLCRPARGRGTRHYGQVVDTPSRDPTP